MQSEYYLYSYPRGSWSLDKRTLHATIGEYLYQCYRVLNGSSYSIVRSRYSGVYWPEGHDLSVLDDVAIASYLASLENSQCERTLWSSLNRFRVACLSCTSRMTGIAPRRHKVFDKLRPLINAPPKPKKPHNLELILIKTVVCVFTGLHALYYVTTCTVK